VTEKASNGAPRVRISRIAREHGLSVQAIRNYVDWGMLPPTERAPNGYRIFTQRHADALRTVLALMEAHGWQCARRIMSAIHAGDVQGALAELDRSNAELHRERTQVRQVLQALQGEVPPRLVVRRPLRIADAAAAVGVRPSALRFWERVGLLEAGRERVTGYRTYDTVQLTRARVLVLLRQAGYRLPDVRAVLEQMAGGDPAGTRAALARREQQLDRTSRLRLRAAALLDAYLG